MEDFRMGQGFDSHRFTPGEGVVLGGVRIPCGFALLGHSDADLLTHALIDSLLGALALGDIGQWFPDTEPAYAGIRSVELLRRVLSHPAMSAAKVVNVDSTLIAERPRLSQWIPEIRRSLSEVLGCPISRVSVKAKTAEGMGFCGSGEGMAAQVCVLLRMVGVA